MFQSVTKPISRALSIIALSIISLTLYANEASDLPNGKYAVITTDKGEIIVKLEYEKAPLTVINFAALALGQKTNAIKEDAPYYDGLKFHRVIKDFMIQGGDPLGNGSGGPGYQFPDEITDLKHDKAGTLSMANSGPATNGSQFFITHKETPWLDGKHTVFGYVISGQEVVDNIQQDDTIKNIVIKDVGEQAEAFKTNEDAFVEYSNKFKQTKIKQREERLQDLKKFVDEHYPNAEAKNGYFVVKTQENADIVKNADSVNLDLQLNDTDGVTLVENKNLSFPIDANFVPVIKENIQTMNIDETITIISLFGSIGMQNIPPEIEHTIVILTLTLNGINE